MKRYDANAGIPTLEVALSEYMNADDLKKLGALTKEKLPTRKADLAQVIVRHLDGERLRAVWQGLDEIQRAAVAEVVHSGSTQFPADRFGGRPTSTGTTAARRRCASSSTATASCPWKPRPSLLIADDVGLTSRLAAVTSSVPRRPKGAFSERRSFPTERPRASFSTSQDLRPGTLLAGSASPFASSTSRIWERSTRGSSSLSHASPGRR
jgi:hypothetical protein